MAQVILEVKDLSFDTYVRRSASRGRVVPP